MQIVLNAYARAREKLVHASCRVYRRDLQAKDLGFREVT